MSAPLTGPASAHGRNSGTSSTPTSNRSTERRGTWPKAALTVVDDGYDPEKAVANTRTLIETNKVFALLGYYGSTAMTEAMNKVFGPAKVPMIGGISGAMSLRQPPAGNPNNRYMFSQRASLLMKPRRSATSWPPGSEDTPLCADWARPPGGPDHRPEGTNLAPGDCQCERNSEDTARQWRPQQGQPQAVVMVTLFKPTAALVKALHKANQSPMFMTLSPVGAGA